MTEPTPASLITATPTTPLTTETTKPETPPTFTPTATSTPLPPTGTPTPTSTPTATPTPTPILPSADPPTSPNRVSGVFENFETNTSVWKLGDQPNGRLVRSSTQAKAGNFSGQINYDFSKATNEFVVFLKTYPLAGQPTGITADVYGDGSGHYLNVWIKDARGEVWQATFGKIEHEGWQTMTAWLDPSQGWPNGHVQGPENKVIDYPISFHALALDDAPDNNSGSGVIYVDNLAVADNPRPPDDSTDPAPLATSPPPTGLSGRIAFPVDDSGKYNIWIADLSQMPDVSPRRVVVGARQPNFYKTSGQLLVNGEGVNPGLNIRLYSRSFQFQRIVSESPHDSYPFWSPGGERLVYSRSDLDRIFINCSVERPSLQGNEECRRLEEYGVVTTDRSGQLVADMPVWTQDGAQLIVRWKAGGPNNGLASIGSWATFRDNNPLKALPDPILLLRSDQARPTDAHGNTIYFFDFDGENNNWEVYTLNLNSNIPVNLSNSPDSNDGLPTVSPDGQWVAFVSNRNGKWAVWTAPVQGGAAQKLFDLPKADPWGRGDHDWTTERISWGP